MGSLPGCSAVVLVGAVRGMLGVVVSVGTRHASRAAVSAHCMTLISLSEAFKFVQLTVNCAFAVPLVQPWSATKLQHGWSM
jgi:hypothetical protein